MTDGPEICVVIVTYNSDPTIARCLAALGGQTYRNFSVVLVENGGTPSAGAALALAGAPAQLIEPGANLGFAAGNNRGVAHAPAGATWIAALNPDAFAAPDWLERFVEATRRYPQCGMFGSLQMQDGSNSRVDGRGDRYHAFGFAWRAGRKDPLPPKLADTETFSPCAAAAFYRRDLFEAVGGFDEALFNHMEDVDIGFRLRLAGQHCIQLAAARVSHVGGASSPSAFATFHGMRNTVLVFGKNMPAALLGPLLPFHLAALGLLCLHHAIKGNGLAAVRGVGASLGKLGAMRAARRGVQKRRKASVRTIARALTWSWIAPLRMTASDSPPPVSAC
ncbi:MAG: glycosyltransferase family 2 protein [Alphaproteobacteria bacterium]|nr:glycosyltransferase family 2 protein [Alphaproteobacteria bacterium]